MEQTSLVILIIISLIPVVLLLWYFDRQDKEHKESRRFLWRIFLWGVAITGLAAGVELILELYVLDLFYSPIIRLVVHAFIFVAAIEEALKYWVVKKKVWDHPAFDEYFDGIMYAVTASLGFAALENVLYVTGGGLYVAVIRALMAVPAHALFGAMMGYYIGLARFEKDPNVSKKLLFKGLVLAIFFHGMYDFLLFSESLMAILVVPMILGMYINVRRKIRHLQYLDKMKNALMPVKWTWFSHIKTGIGMIFFTIGILMIFTITLYVTKDPIAADIFTDVEFDLWSSIIFVGVAWLIAYPLIKEKKPRAEKNT